MKLIELTKIDHGCEHKILFNLEWAIEIESSMGGGAHILMDGETLNVRETPAEIKAMIEVDFQQPNPLEWQRITHPMTWPCVRCEDNHEVPSRGYMCPKCVEADKDAAKFLQIEPLVRELLHSVDAACSYTVHCKNPDVLGEFHFRLRRAFDALSAALDGGD